MHSLEVSMEAGELMMVSEHRSVPADRVRAPERA